MEDIVQQVGALLIGAVPTILLFVVLVAAYQLLVQGPLNRVLAERRARTEGAVENAHKAIADAEAKAAEYADKLRLARAEIFKMREQRAKQRNAERESALDETRKAAGTKVAQGRPFRGRLENWPIRWFERCFRLLPGVPVEIEFEAFSS